MAMTKRFKVTFDMTVVITSEQEENMKNNVMRLAKKAHEGGKLDALEREFLVRALTDGPEGAAVFAMQQSVRKAIRSELTEDGIKLSPARVEVIR